MKFYEKSRKLTCDTIIECLKPWYNLTSFLGITPYKLTKDEFGKEKLKLSWKILLTLIYYFSYTYVFIAYFPNVSGKTHMNKLISVGNYTIYPVLASVSVTILSLQTKKSFKILEKITKIDNRFKVINVKFSYEKLQKSLIIQVILAFVVQFLLATFILPYLFELQTTVYPLQISYSYFWVEYCGILYLLRSWVLLKVTKNRFISINNKLLSYIEKKFKKCLPSLSDGQILERKLEENDIKEEIKILRILHEKLINVCEIINEVEEIPFICTMIHTLNILITNFFFAFNAWYNHAANIAASVIQAFVVICNCTFMGFFLIPIFSRTSKEVRIFESK